MVQLKRQDCATSEAHLAARDLSVWRAKQRIAHSPERPFYEDLERSSSEAIDVYSVHKPEVALLCMAQCRLHEQAPMSDSAGEEYFVWP